MLQPLESQIEMNEAASGLIILIIKYILLVYGPMNPPFVGLFWKSSTFLAAAVRTGLYPLRPTEGALRTRLCDRLTLSLRSVLSWARSPLWRGEATGWRWDVFNALINVTASSFDVEQTRRPRCEERLMCWWRNSILRGFANYGPHICLHGVSPVKRLRVWNIQNKGP